MRRTANLKTIPSAFRLAACLLLGSALTGVALHAQAPSSNQAAVPPPQSIVTPPAGTHQTEVASKYLALKYYATPDAVRPDLRLTLVADVQLQPKMHVYSPTVKGYIPIQLQIAPSPNFSAQPPDYPKPDLLMLPAINEVVPVYQNHFRITDDVTMAASNVLQPLIAGDGTLKINGTLRYQACDDKICYLPETVPLEWVLKIAPPGSK